MATVRLDIGGKTYVLGCEDGGEDHLREMAARIDAKARLITPQMGAPGDGRLMLMAALMIADELDAAQTELVEAGTRLATLRRDYRRLESRVADALEAAAARLEAMAPEDMAFEGTVPEDTVPEESSDARANDDRALVAKPPAP